MLTTFFIGLLSISGQVESGPAVDAGVVTMPPMMVVLDASSVDAASMPDASVKVDGGVLSPASLPFDPSGDLSAVKVGSVIPLFKKAITDKNWFFAAGVLLFLLVLLARNIALPLFGVSKPEDYDRLLPIISAVLSSLPTIAVKLLEPNVDLMDLASTSVGCFVVATGAWKVSKSTIKKLPSVTVRTKKEKVVAEVKPDPEPTTEPTKEK